MSEQTDDTEAITFRVPRGTRDRMTAIAKEYGHTLDEELVALVEDAEDALAEEAEESEWWNEVSASVKRLKADPEAWADYVAELEEFDGLRPARGQCPEYQQLPRAESA